MLPNTHEHWSLLLDIIPFFSSHSIVVGIGTLIGALLGPRTDLWHCNLYWPPSSQVRWCSDWIFFFEQECIYLILCLVGVVSTFLSVILVIASEPILLAFDLMSFEGKVSLSQTGFVLVLYILWNLEYLSHLSYLSS